MQQVLHKHNIYPLIMINRTSCAYISTKRAHKKDRRELTIYALSGLYYFTALAAKAASVELFTQQTLFLKRLLGRIFPISYSKSIQSLHKCIPTAIIQRLLTCDKL